MLGITKPILYRYFADRDGLLTAVAERFADSLAAQLQTVLDSAVSPAERIRLAIDRYVAFIEMDPALYGFFAHHAALAGPAVRSVVDRVAATLARALDEGLRAATMDPEPAETWAYGIVGMVHLAGAHWAAQPSVPRDRLIDYLTLLTWSGLQGSPGDNGVDRGREVIRERASRNPTSKS